jgi:hypothetical protein
MPKNIKNITLEIPPDAYNDVPLVKINFNFPCTWTTLHAEDLEQILRLWIQGEKKKLNGKYNDALYLKKLIQKVFEEETVPII